MRGDDAGHGTQTATPIYIVFEGGCQPSDMAHGEAGIASEEGTTSPCIVRYAYRMKCAISSKESLPESLYCSQSKMFVRCQQRLLASMTQFSDNYTMSQGHLQANSGFIITNLIFIEQYYKSNVRVTHHWNDQPCYVLPCFGSLGLSNRVFLSLNKFPKLKESMKEPFSLILCLITFFVHTYIRTYENFSRSLLQ